MSEQNPQANRLKLDPESMRAVLESFTAIGANYAKMKQEMFGDRLDGATTIEEVCYRLGGIVGVDPGPFTLRELVWMAEEKLAREAAGRKSMIRELAEMGQAAKPDQAESGGSRSNNNEMQNASALAIPTGLDEMLSQVKAVPPGKEHWDEYERLIEGLLTAIFSPVLTNPERQCRIHDGRKKIDITYTNTANAGFFHWLAMHYSAAHIFVEAKNYGKDIANPELDQLAGRFSENRGMVGLLVCRGFENKDHFLKRCRDTATDKRGFIIPVDDDDLEILIRGQMGQSQALAFPLLRDRFENLVMNRDH